MMITPEYCQMMARYNAWQNAGLREVVGGMPHDAVMRDQGAFFGSIFATLNHLLWADQLWFGRFGIGPGRQGTIAQSTEMTPTVVAWGAERYRMDVLIATWAAGVTAVDLTGTFSYQSVVMGGEVSKPMGQIVAHVFNHQTHHRGQVHAMLTAQGVLTEDTDLVFMPEGF